MAPLTVRICSVWWQRRGPRGPGRAPTCTVPRFLRPRVPIRNGPAQSHWRSFPELSRPGEWLLATVVVRRNGTIAPFSVHGPCRRD